MTLLPFSSAADMCPTCGVDHAELDEWRCCPRHGHELTYDGSNGERYRYMCPVRGCGYERWIRKPPVRKEPPMTTQPAIHHPQTAIPATELAIRDDQQRFDKYQLAALRQIGIQDAPNAELAVFFHYCKAHRLDPFSRHVTMVKYGDGWTIQTEIDGYRYIGHRAANRRGDVVSISAPVYIDMDGQRHPHWVRQGPPGMVEVTIVKNGAPFTGQANYFEFVQVHGPYLKGGKPNPKAGQPRGLWEKMPANQTRKCAEAQAWRMAYQDEFADIPTEVPIPSAATGWDAPGDTARLPGALEPQSPHLEATKAVIDEWERLSIYDDERLVLSARLAGEDFIPDDFGDFTVEQLATVIAALKKCGEVGQVHALIGHGDKPGSTS